MAYRRQSQSRLAPLERQAISRERKKKESPLLTAFESLLARASLSSGAAQRQRTTEHLLAQLVCLGSHTITSLLSARGRQFTDWSADYRMYERNRVDPEHLFAAVRKQLCEKDEEPIVAALDDTRLRKTGRKVHGAKFMRDPMGPPFCVNFIRAQRFVQTSMASTGCNGQARMIPVDWMHAPLPQKPPRKAPQAQWDTYKAQSKAASISKAGLTRIDHLRTWLNENGAKERALWSVVDGSFTNGTVLKNLPANTILVGRIRSDAKLFHLPEQQPVAQGRRRCYGNPAPTPEQLRLDSTNPWQHVEVFFGGTRRELRAKQLGPVRWRAAGGDKNLQLIVIAPTPYRLTQNAKLLYRNPAYLICTDPNAPLAQVIQHYLWRWDIEVNFRDQKTLLGLGDAQVRTQHAVQNVTGLSVAAYAMLLTAAENCRQTNTPHQHLPTPKWQRKKTKRVTTMDLIQNLRYELWAKAIHFSDFEKNHPTNTKPQKTIDAMESAVFYATRYS